MSVATCRGFLACLIMYLMTYGCRMHCYKFALVDNFTVLHLNYGPFNDTNMFLKILKGPMVLPTYIGVKGYVRVYTQNSIREIY